MKVLKGAEFAFMDKLIEFVKKNDIQKEDIQAIIPGSVMGYALFYYTIA